MTIRGSTSVGLQRAAEDFVERGLAQERLGPTRAQGHDRCERRRGDRAGPPRGADLILLDLIMPGVDGFEALRRLKEDPRTRAIPVIVLSNLGRDEDVRRALDGGAGSFLIKSDLSLDDLVAHVKQALAEPAMSDTTGDLEASRPGPDPFDEDRARIPFDGKVREILQRFSAQSRSSRGQYRRPALAPR